MVVEIPCSQCGGVKGLEKMDGMICAKCRYFRRDIPVGATICAHIPDCCACAKFGKPIEGMLPCPCKCHYSAELQRLKNKLAKLGSRGAQWCWWMSDKWTVQYLNRKISLDGRRRRKMDDTCLVCGTVVPPGPDFCGAVCEERAKARTQQALRVLPFIGPLLDAWEGTDLSFRSDLSDQYQTLHDALQNIYKAVEQG